MAVRGSTAYIHMCHDRRGRSSGLLARQQRVTIHRRSWIRTIGRLSQRCTPRYARPCIRLFVNTPSRRRRDTVHIHSCALVQATSLNRRCSGCRENQKSADGPGRKAGKARQVKNAHKKLTDPSSFIKQGCAVLGYSSRTSVVRLPVRSDEACRLPTAELDPKSGV